MKNLALSLLIFTPFMFGCDGARKEPGDMSKSFVVIGLDGLDPTLAQQYMDEGILPNFKKLKESGGFKPLGTSNPPQSPVAWSNFISGHNPGAHSVFDFIARDPKTYIPEIGMTEKVEKKPATFKELFKGMGPNIQTRRKGRSFWDGLSDKNIPSTILHCPVTFPADELKGNLIAGMGAPDLKGTQGIFSYYSSRKPDDKDIQGRFHLIEWKGKNASTMITGPRVKKGDKTEETTVPVEIERLTENKIIISIQGQSQGIQVGEWTDWFTIKYSLGFMKSVTGIVRFHLNALSPDIELYASPVNIDPSNPAFKISHPDSYAKELFKHVGYYYTQGMPYDTWALNEDRIDEKTFLELAYKIQEENLAQLRFELDRYEGGFLFAYFGITDLISHMFWRYIDDQHPNKGDNPNPKVQNAIRDVYQHMDGVLGEIMEKVPQDGAFVVISDHGFGSFRRAVHVNSWLKENGYLALQNDAEEGSELFQNVDWTRTKAYSVGFGGIYVNQFGREQYGTVYKGAETEALKKEIVEKLKDWKDVNGESMIKAIYNGEDLYSGPFSEKGPDLFIGFEKGYRASWQTALGAAPKGLVEDNMKKWGGDHLCDPSTVPGVLFANQNIVKENPDLIDLAPTILKYFGVQEDGLEGQSLF